MLALILLACASSTSAGDVRGPGHGGHDTTSAGDDTDSADPRELVDVASDRELRGVWVATVANIDFPSSTSLTAEEQEAELDRIVDVCAAAHLNAIFFQVRPEGDALYASDLEPWSRYLTGTQGKDPGYDPLSYLIGVAHAHGIEVHAWFNPYRAKASSSSAAVSPHWTVTDPEYAYTYGSSVWMDPGAKVVQDRTVDVIADVVARYDVDGVHFDDYFYPYPNGTDFPDDATYADYQASGGTLLKDDWRRDNVNTLVRRVSETVAAEKPWVRFGIGPFGIYRPGQPDGISGLDQYAEIYADPPTWKANGWVDYLAPQLYWPSTQTAQAYGPLVDWWSALPPNGPSGRYTFAGNYLSKLGTSDAYDLDEFRTEVALGRADRALGSQGNLWFSMTPLLDDTDGVVEVFATDLYPRPALTPPLSTAKETVPPPEVVLSGSTATVSASAADVPPRAWAVYKADGDGWTLDQLVPAAMSAIPLSSGRWAISEVDKAGVESRAVVLTVPG